MCPRCRRRNLYPTGAFWICSACGLAITEQALHYEQDDGIARRERDIERNPPMVPARLREGQGGGPPDPEDRAAVSASRS
jgi:hypothetical protein